MMTNHSKAIIEKMNGSNYIELNFEFAFKLTNESERGAILIGSSKVENYLRSLIIAILPSKQKQYTSRLMNYPGPLSSFSGKIELTYAFGIIDKQVYDCLTCLRKIRNEAAHSDEVFSLQLIKDRLEKIYDFEYGFPNIIHELSFNNLIKWKKMILETKVIEEGLEGVVYEELWNEIYSDPKNSNALQEQMTIWKLAYGLTFLCLKLEVIKDEYLIVHSG